MQSDAFTRRTFLKGSALLAAPLVSAAGEPPLISPEAANRRLRIVCVGGHPDDPESGCAGTLTRYAALGHSVTVLYLTRGERGIRGQGLEEASRIRSAECEKACAIIGAKPEFFGQIDGATEITRTHIETMSRLLSVQRPDVLFTHWPIDRHLDHQVASLLTLRGWMALPTRPHLYFFEVNTGSQSQGFLPNTYVDVTQVLEKKKAALLAHVSQNGADIWHEHHEPIATWRGREAGVAAAEAFVHLNRDSQFSNLPGI